MVSPRMATAWAQGAARSPVQTRPTMSRSAAGARLQPARMKTSAASFRIMRILAPGQPAQCFQFFEGARAGGCRRGGGDREQVADVEQDLQHQLVPHVRVLEILAPE